MPKIVSARVIITCPGRNFVTLKVECDDGTTGLVAEHRLEEDEAHDVTRALAYDLIKQACRL